MDIVATNINRVVSENTNLNPVVEKCPNFYTITCNNGSKKWRVYGIDKTTMTDHAVDIARLGYYLNLGVDTDLRKEVVTEVVTKAVQDISHPWGQAAQLFANYIIDNYAAWCGVEGKDYITPFCNALWWATGSSMCRAQLPGQKVHTTYVSAYPLVTDLHEVRAMSSSELVDGELRGTFEVPTFLEGFNKAFGIQRHFEKLTSPPVLPNFASYHMKQFSKMTGCSLEELAMLVKINEIHKAFYGKTRIIAHNCITLHCARAMAATSANAESKTDLLEDAVDKIVSTLPASVPVEVDPNALKQAMMACK